jgi:sec-independent protein translocase protein TatA
MFGLSGWHLLLVLVVFVLLFGAGRISGLMADLAKGLKSFKKGMADSDDEQAATGAKLVTHEREAAEPRGKRTVAKAGKRG